MTEKVHLSRRGFLAANAAVAAAATIPGQASACAGKHAASAAMSWDTVTGDQMAGLIGERFRINSPEAGELVLKLVAVDRVEGDVDRPAHLPRAEALTAVFDSPDKALLVACGAGISRVSHPRLGAADLYVGPTCLRNGDHELEIVLN